ncbi:MAG TPA: response regulator [Candidatus Saccharimonadales bacterium]|nr:response regulator [Candidatus Saccharimonadales bacterium]
MTHVLIVEADRLLGNNIAAAFTLRGHSATFTPDAQAAINAADAKTPDVIILDLMLAGRSGIEFLYELRSYPDWQTLPVIVYSNLAPANLILECDISQLGIEQVFHKPTTKISDLVAEVERLAAKSKV